jgi:16S rRNA (guanine527-N7)-methyltransferase
MELITKYFPDLNPTQIEHFTKLEPLYADWNSKINVISRKDFDKFYCNHVLHSLSIAKFTSFDDGQRVMDIGTGGGFPGIPLAIMFPSCHFTLVDSIGKKTTVAREIAKYLGLENVSVINDRCENIPGPFDVIVSRAVAPALKLVNFTAKSIEANGRHIFLKGGDLTNEKKEVKKFYPDYRWKEQAIKQWFTEDFFETKKVIELK